MSRIRPLGILQFSKSNAVDVIAYNLYGKPVASDVDAASVAFDYDKDLLQQFPAPDASQSVVQIDLSKVNGLTASDGGNYAFAVASVDQANNISDFSAAIIHPLDATAPDAPTNLQWLDATATATAAGATPSGPASVGSAG